ncbi:hypothetical protein BS47DRAFT_1370999 [Hydnum rufescens UP504]|uniref:Clavaminate synthase-like protein n=1 Tax=Hydnum rufescens UP504 TaxID=1448309 RepID=A0A9P6B6M5_9AGAM|nr:hypothetical protein BS47DRAFT_1370999 [Hydnum rufescens UP504]
MDSLPVIDLDIFLQDPFSQAAIQEAQNAADALIHYGALVVKDSRVAEADNEQFLDLMEDYFNLPEEELKRAQGIRYQVGVTLEGTERPKCASDESCLHIIERLAPSERPLDITGHGADPKCRFFWKMSTPPPYETKFPSTLADVWESRLETWGKSMKTAVEGVAEMTALGLGLDRASFTDAGKYGPHLLAPTASDLRKYGQKNTILAGFHTDLNFCEHRASTIHGRSRYPGLHIWGRNSGNRIAVRVPPGRYLLVQAGKQLEHLTGGLICAGFHEVVVNDDTISVVTVTGCERSKVERPLIRISSTFFWHLSSDYELSPIESLQSAARARTEEEPVTIYPSMLVGQQVQNELKYIALLT